MALAPGFEPGITGLTAFAAQATACFFEKRPGGPLVVEADQMVTGGKVNSRWLQAQDLDLFSGFSLILEACSV